MNRLRAMIAEYDSAIWIRVMGTALSTLTGFMLRPFLALYLYDKLEGSVLLPMLVVGLQPLAGMILGLWGGSLADRYGRKPLMMLALLIQAGSMLGFAFAESVWTFAVLTILNGLGMALFLPAANAQVADVVPQEKRAQVFALLHTAFNLGSAIGPVIGLLIFKQNPALVFTISAVASLIYAGMVFFKIQETLPAAARIKAEKNETIPFVFAEHKSLYWLTLLAVPVGLLYAQVDSTFPLHLKNHFANFEDIYVTLITLNGIFVITMQIWLAKKTEQIAPEKVLFFAYMSFVVVCFGYGWAPGLALLILFEFIFTIGEMLNGPHVQKVVSMMAPEELRGRYFSIFALSWQSARSFGPLLGGVILEYLGGGWLFAVIGALLFVSAFAQRNLIRKVKQQKEKEAQVQAATAV
ncbi:MDR family MFS transporter [Brevibacillus dissolubilis]|uniref:MDR family MFS transporter n=1 Tax=Brevibacillus dissolubilis TaxID=1844116 RepID=UPI001115C51A|nr:MFS transporter [Brevibacillus dissolubilis]